MKDLTTPQSNVLRFIHEHTLVTDRPPTVSEIQSTFNWSSRTTVYAHLQRLEAKGYLERKRSNNLKRYAIRLTQRALSFLNRQQQPSVGIGFRLAGDVIAVDFENLLLREILPDTQPGDFLYLVPNSLYTKDGYPAGTAVVMRPVRTIPQEGFALIRINDVIRFRKFRVVGSEIFIEDQQLPHTSIASSRNDVHVIAIVVASVHINSWL